MTEPDGRQGASLPLNQNDVPALVRRLNRATGQLNAVARMLEAGEGCADVIPQFVAARRALDRVAFMVIESAMTTRLTNPQASTVDRERLERLFLSMS